MAAEYYRADRCAHADTDRHRPTAEHGPNGFDLHALSGNLCRCTGYRPIRDAAFASARPPPTTPGAAPRAARARTGRRPNTHRTGSTFVRPATLPEALRLLRERPDAVVVAG